jgi:serine/threonine protein kinase
MPPRLPERYRLNIRLGSDGDIEEWLAQDTSLDRPVLVRYLAPEASHARHATFLAGVRSAAALTEMHLQKVFAAGETSASAYSVSEWDGGVTFADRIRAGEGLPVEEFLPNAAGLCVALSRFHDSGGVHGALDTSAVHFSAAHPAKIGAFGRDRRWNDQPSDTRALAEVLRAGLTGTDDPSVMPSEVLDGVDPAVDEALTRGIAGDYDAATIAAHLSSVSFEPEASAPPVKPWRSLVVFSVLALAISLLAAVGLAADFDPDSPFLYPVGGESVSPSTTTPIAVDEPEDTDTLSAVAGVYDPLGDGTESDDEVDNVTDGSPSTSWKTEAYSLPIREIKDGVGLVFDVEGTPGTVFIRGSADTTFLLGWADAVPEDPEAWEHIARGTLLASEVQFQLPVRGGGVWRLWLIDLPERADGSYQAVINEVRFAK